MANYYSTHELPIFWIIFLVFAIVFNVYCSNKFVYNIFCGTNSISTYSRKDRFQSTSVHFSTSQQEVVRLKLYPSLSFLKSSKVLNSNSHYFSNSDSSLILSENSIKRPRLVVDLKFAERLRSSQKNDSLPLVNDIIVTEQKRSWVVYIIINSLNALPSYRGITNMNVDLIYGNRVYHNKFKVMKEHQIRLLKYVVSDLPSFGTFTLVDHATSWKYDSLPFRVVPYQPKRRMAICTYISSYNTVNEIRFFLAFYLVQKVDTIIFYCPDNYEYFSRLLKKEIESGYVILYNYPWPLSNDFGVIQNSLQISQVNSCYYRHRSFYQYIISIDMDEYLYSELLPYDLYNAIVNSFRFHPPKDDIAVELCFCLFSVGSIVLVYGGYKS